MASRSSLTLASMVIALFAANAQAAIVAQWLLDEQGISDGTVATDTTGNWNGVYIDGSFFATGTFTSVTGHDGIPNSAVAFNKDAFIQVDTPPDPNDPNDPGGILTNNDLGTNGWHVEFWMRPDANFFKHTVWSENRPSGAGPVLLMQTRGDIGDPNTLYLNDFIEGAKAGPPGGFQTEQWYYVAGVFDPLGTQTINIYISDGTTIWSDTSTRTEARVISLTDRFRLNGNFVELGVALALDNFTIYDTPFDPNSELIQLFGVPEPTSLAMLGLGGLLLARRRQGA